MVRSLLCGCYGVSSPIPQSHDPRSVLLGSLKRNAADVGNVSEALLKELKAFIIKDIATWPICEPLEPTEWLEECKLPQFKKDEMLREYNRVYLPQQDSILDKMKNGKFNELRIAKTFGKSETLTDIKTTRAINPTSPAYKYIVGPYFHWLEKFVFFDGPLKNNFVKSVPVKQRPQYINDALGSNYDESKT